MSRIGALQLREAVLDDGSFISWDTAPLAVATSDTYRRELAAASVANLDVDPELSILLAIEAVQTTRSTGAPVLREAEDALHRAVRRLAPTLSSTSSARAATTVTARWCCR